ncbi:MAG TPA: ABC transporter ATP-binding protein [Kribbella sp.]|jgi:peptide/nickel transport system ATP-binding protein
MAVLEVKHLSVELPTEDGIIHAVQDVSFAVEAGRLFGIVGESGSGKSVLTQAITGLLPFARISGQALLDGVDLLSMSATELRGVRGSRIGMVFQDPMSSLHPYYTIGAQISEMVRTHERVSAPAAKARVVEILGRVGIQNAAERYSSYPHQFSGGMRQRVMLAMALVLNPPLVIADEPTTALDVTVQAKILDLIRHIQQEFGTTIVMISHDLALLSNVADDVMVMYAGNRLEIGSKSQIFSQPAHPYTAGLLRSSPANYLPGQELVPIPGLPPSLLSVSAGCVFADRCGNVMSSCAERPPLRRFVDGGESNCWLEQPPAASKESTAAAEPATDPEMGPLGRTDWQPALQPGATGTSELAASARGVRLSFTSGLVGSRQRVEVLKGIDLEIRRGETMGLVGESGCGKTTLARVIAGLIPATAGTVDLAGANVGALTRTQWKRMRREVQLVFQDPSGSLNPRRRVGSIIGEPYRVHRVADRAERKRRVQEIMEIVGLNPEHYNRFPSEFSGGQRQRIGIARALTLNPSLIICDEPVSALDVSIQAQILNLLKSLQRQFNLTYLFISHDLSVVRHICDRIAVMEEGVIVELGPTESLYTNPQAAFTRTLLQASTSGSYAPADNPHRLLETVSPGGSGNE